jgi:hypothetical protein
MVTLDNKKTEANQGMGKTVKKSKGVKPTGTEHQKEKIQKEDGRANQKGGAEAGQRRMEHWGQEMEKEESTEEEDESNSSSEESEAEEDTTTTRSRASSKKGNATAATGLEASLIVRCTASMPLLARCAAR